MLTQKETDNVVKEHRFFSFTRNKGTSTFTKATEKDIRGIHEVCTSLWSNKTPDYNARLNSYQQNDSIYYITKNDDTVIGFLGIIPFKRYILETLMRTEHDEFYPRYQEILKMPDSILPFISGKPIYSLSLDVQVRKGTPEEEKYGARLIQGCIEALIDLIKQNIIIEKLHVSSGVTHAIQLCRNMGFTEYPPLPKNDRKRFELDLATAKSPLARGYQKALGEFNAL